MGWNLNDSTTEKEKEGGERGRRKKEREKEKRQILYFIQLSPKLECYKNQSRIYLTLNSTYQPVLKWDSSKTKNQIFNLRS